MKSQRLSQLKGRTDHTALPLCQHLAGVEGPNQPSLLVLLVTKCAALLALGRGAHEGRAISDSLRTKRC